MGYDRAEERVKPKKQSPTPREKPSLRARAVAGLFPALLIVAGLAAYHNSFNGPFIFDDIRAIPENPRIRKLWPLSEVVASPPGLTLGGRPVVSVTLAAQLRAGRARRARLPRVQPGRAPAVDARALRDRAADARSARDCSDRYGERAEAIAFATALLWTVHPLLSESVDYVVQRSELLMGLFYLSTLYCFIRSLDSPRPRAWQVAACITGALAIGSKEVAVSVPLAVLLYDWLFVPGPLRKRLPVHAALWAMVLVGGIAVAQARAGAFPEGGLTSWQYLKTQAGVIAHYLRLSFWPSPLVVDYYGWPPAESLVPVLLPGLLIVTLIALTVWALRRALGARLPRGDLLHGARADVQRHPAQQRNRGRAAHVSAARGDRDAGRRSRAPRRSGRSPGASGTHAWRARSAWRCWCRRPCCSAQRPCGATPTTGPRSRSGPTPWRSGRTTRADTRTWVSPSTRPDGTDEAIAAYEQALRVEPGFVTAQRNLVAARMRRGQLPEAAGSTRTPDYGETRINLSAMLIGQGRFEDALEQAREAVKIDPKSARAQHNLGVCLAHLSRWEEALAAHRESLALDPTQSETHNDLGVALASLGRIPEALKHFEEAVRLKPGNEKAGANRDRARTMVSGGRRVDRRRSLSLCAGRG